MPAAGTEAIYLPRRLTARQERMRWEPATRFSGRRLMVYSPRVYRTRSIFDTCERSFHLICSVRLVLARIVERIRIEQPNAPIQFAIWCVYLSEQQWRKKNVRLNESEIWFTTRNRTKTEIKRGKIAMEEFFVFSYLILSSRIEIIAFKISPA